MSLAQFVQLVTLSSGCALIATVIAGAVDMWRGRK
jgi:hypothetical protein